MSGMRRPKHETPREAIFHKFSEVPAGPSGPGLQNPILITMTSLLAAAMSTRSPLRSVLTGNCRHVPNISRLLAQHKT
jgi:hypothetical protein